GVDRAIVQAGSGALYEPVEACLSSAASRLRFPAGDLRTYELAWTLPESREARLDAEGAIPGPIEALVEAASLRSRDCLPRLPSANGSLAYRVHIGTRGRQVTAEVDVVDSLGSGVDACVARQFSGMMLDETLGDEDTLGVARIWYRLPTSPGVAAPQATTRVGYELQVSAFGADPERGEIGRTRLVLGPGVVPDLRIRATPPLAKPGEEVVFDFLRGPSFGGTLPEEVILREGSRELAKAKVDLDARKVVFTVPDDADGFLSLEHGGARAVVFVQRPNPLSVTMTTDKVVYRPGDQATLSLTTRAGDVGSPAAVSLIGVDQSLGQLAPLLAPDDWGRVTVRVTADRPAFGAFDPRALVLGQVTGENAARAAVLRITQIPADFAGEDRISASSRKEADTTSALVDGFWRVHAATASSTRSWEAAAPPGELLPPGRVAAWWSEALDAEEQAGRAPVDGFGRRLDLTVLPHDLLAELDPRRLVGDATRLPEDDVGWMRYIDEEVR
ncbi:MAG: hypothetical protein H0V89_07330, partial [Deltaproteobacteria bacterium]|nr:hypothetical protein [Deltaproteobacteria bacterium]